MRNKNTLFYRGKTSVELTFSSSEISSDGSLIMLEKLERDHRLIHYYSKLLPDTRDSRFITYTRKQQLKQRVYMIMLGYEDANDVNHLHNDPLFKDVLQGDLASQPTISRFENSFDKQAVFKFCDAWLYKYVSSLSDRKRIVIDVDSTDDPTHGSQQLSMFNGYYSQFMYNELFFHDGKTGQIILPVLRPGNSHSNKWYVSILKRIIIKIRESHPEMEIIIRSDSGFSCAPFYQLVDDFDLLYVTGIASNEVLKRKVSWSKNAVKKMYLDQGEKHQHFMSFTYKAKSWHKPQQCYSKVESTGLGMNIRYFSSNLPQKDAREIYFDFYVKRGDSSENRIKEVKNMCFSDRLSNHSFLANFFRLMMSSLAYEMFLLLKQKIKKTRFEVAKKWLISSIRTYLLKVGATIKITKRRIYYQLSKSFVYKGLFREIITQ
ncbi:IS1380 family transposase [Ichthyobacterium seriolicida]|uniref:Transposase n=1 Tax=Ichthyobacterium seriolicida TaxID=242600 RepID=A0A1J1DZB2_9FLAO|nr:IS1380 family transposase [Ichthyobacterium seriolicida]BAV95233.1 transposase [Ichthyobacterium seriolicida]